MPTYYTPKIIQSRGSSSDSRPSYDSTSSDEQVYASSKSSTMRYYGGSQGKVEKPFEHKYRAPDAENKYVESKSRGNVEVIHHKRRGYDPVEPRVSEATSSDYRVKRDETRHSSSHHSSHKHSSYRR